MKDYFTVNELAREFGVNPKTIYRRLWAKEIPAYKVLWCLVACGGLIPREGLGGLQGRILYG